MDNNIMSHIIFSAASRFIFQLSNGISKCTTRTTTIIKVDFNSTYVVGGCYRTVACEHEGRQLINILMKY